MAAENDRRDAIRDELSRIEESAKYSAQSQLEQSKLWSRANLWLGITSSVLAAVAGALALANVWGKEAAGPLALIAARTFGRGHTSTSACRKPTAGETR